MSDPLSDNPADLVGTQVRLVREIRALARPKTYRDPEKAKSLDAYDPIVEFSIINNDDKTPVVSRAFCHAKIADFRYPREALMLNVTADGSATVLVAPWAASADAERSKPEPALPAALPVGAVLSEPPS
jgi:hypothetical protein